MPILRITYHRGSLTDAQKMQLAEELTPVTLAGEVGRYNPAGRALTYIFFHEMDPRSEWFVGGKPDLNAPNGSRFLLEVQYVEGAATQAEKSEVHTKFNEILARIINVDGTFPNRLTDWTLITEVPEGAWGAGGVTVGVRMANEALGGSPDRSEYFERFLTANQSVIETHGYPTERA